MDGLVRSRSSCDRKPLVSSQREASSSSVKPCWQRSRLIFGPISIWPDCPGTNRLHFSNTKLFGLVYQTLVYYTRCAANHKSFLKNFSSILHYSVQRRRFPCFYAQKVLCHFACGLLNCPFLFMVSKQARGFRFLPSSAAERGIRREISFIFCIVFLYFAEHNFFSAFPYFYTFCSLF